VLAVGTRYAILARENTPSNSNQSHKERHFSLPCSLISAVGIFCLGAGVSIVHGIHAIMEPATSSDLGWGLAVLFLSTFVEGYTLMVAARAVLAGARAAGMRFLDYIRSGRDPVSVAIMAEDGAAVAGVIVAAICTKLVDVTGVAVRYHAHASLSILCSMTTCFLLAFCFQAHSTLICILWAPHDSTTFSLMHSLPLSHKHLACRAPCVSSDVSVSPCPAAAPARSLLVHVYVPDVWPCIPSCVDLGWSGQCTRWAATRGGGRVPHTAQPQLFDRPVNG
jgi:hypothetical protein